MTSKLNLLIACIAVIMATSATAQQIRENCWSDSNPT